jgi:3-oxoacyl-[acyl-carrier protein] reductase
MRNENCFVTGGAGGIGSAACRRLAEEGWTVVVNYKTSKAKALALAAEIGGRAVQADITGPAR